MTGFRLGSIARVIGVTLGFMLVHAHGSAGDTWKGSSTRKDGVLHVMSPAAPAEGISEIWLKESWRIGGRTENSDEMFGVIVRIASDSQGAIYLLDRQLSEVRVFSDHGEYLRTIGREGEGPGEFRRPADMFFLPDGKLAVMQIHPPKIILLSPEGVPQGELPFPRSEAAQVLRRALPSGDRIVLVRRTQEFFDDKYTIHASIDIMDYEGAILATLESRAFDLVFANFKLREQDFDSFQARLAVGPAGRIYTCPDRRPYRIHVWTPDGELTRVIEREYVSYKRNDSERQRVQRIWDMYARAYRETRGEIDDYDKDIRAVYPRPEGFWVLTSRGEREREPGVLGVFDVFDNEGRFQQQMKLHGQGDPREDSYYFIGQRLYVVTNVVGADAASRGGMEGSEDKEPEPTAIICYELGEAVASKE